MKKFTKKEIIEATEQFGSTYLGEVSISLNDINNWVKYLRKNKLDDRFGITHVDNTDHDNGWFLIYIG